MTKNPLILYHFPCAANDGFAGAYAGWCKFGANAEYVPARPGTPPACDFEGRDVYLIDVSYATEHLDCIRAVASSLTILDHHKDAQAILKDYPGAIFDLEKSGATIAWTHFHPGVPVPRLLSHIQDRDLYLFHLADTHDVLALVDTLPYDFAAWDEIAQSNDHAWAEHVQTGRAIRRGKVHNAGLISKEAVEAIFLDTPARIVNAPYCMVNEVADHLLAGYTGIAVLWCVEKSMLRISFRANKRTINVQVLAAQLGGGGHDSAAAVRIPLYSDTAPLGLSLLTKLLSYAT